MDQVFQEYFHNSKGYPLKRFIYKQSWDFRYNYNLPASLLSACRFVKSCLSLFWKNKYPWPFRLVVCSEAPQDCVDCKGTLPVKLIACRALDPAGI